MRFNEYLKKYLAQNHLTYVAFGVKSKIIPSMISKIVSNSDPIEDKDIIEKLSKALEKSSLELEQDFPDDIFFSKTREEREKEKEIEKEKSKTPDNYYDELNNLIHQVPVDKLYELEIFIKTFLKRVS